ncbi:glycosyltransferase family 2 protein [Tepidiphilus margaritifer]|uniref:glycosyltransferase family 2 protein n=1 Tax=Tepidiphilus margaritifer TaxID=203471 RepID=UPI0009FCDC2A|nr:glycosyltransferase family 2 protein [Tepidiphilus margaritifer]
MKLSIITPTYNRKSLIARSLDSSLNFVSEGHAYEVIVVDDASTDGTVEYLQEKYAKEIVSGTLKIIKLKENHGVTGAKNIGAFAARGDWLVFMDSDDFFLQNAGQIIQDELKRLAEFDMIFFRCIDEISGVLIGSASAECSIDFRYILNKGTPGECLPVVKRTTFLRHIYNEELRGCESLSYIKILHSGGRAYVSKEAVRVYRSKGDDRLSSRSNILKRADKMLKYNTALLRYIGSMTPKVAAKITIKAIAYGVISVFARNFNILQDRK